MEPFCRGEKVHYLEHALRAFSAGNPAAFDSDRNRHDAEAAAAAGHRIARAETFAGKAAGRVGVVPKVAERCFLDLFEQIVVADARELVGGIIGGDELKLIIVENVYSEIMSGVDINRYFS